MTGQPLSADQFETLLERHGAQLAQWPQQQGAQAADLLASSAEARLLYAEALATEERLDLAFPEALADSGCVVPPAGLQARVLDDFHTVYGTGATVSTVEPLARQGGKAGVLARLKALASQRLGDFLPAGQRAGDMPFPLSTRPAWQPALAGLVLLVCGLLTGLGAGPLTGTGGETDQILAMALLDTGFFEETAWSFDASVNEDFPAGATGVEGAAQ